MIDKTAVVEDGAELGENVTVGPFSLIMAGTRIGDNSAIGPRVTVFGGTTVGIECDIHAGAILGDTPQDLSFEETNSFVHVGDRCTIREGVTIHRGTKPDTATEVGDDCFLMAFSHLAHNVRLGNKVILANGALVAGYVDIADGVFMGGNAAVHQFAKIGRLVMVGGLAAISKDVPPFSMVATGGTNTVAGLNVVGMRRAGISPSERTEVKQAFKLIYRSGLNVTQAVARIRDMFSHGPALEFCDFIEASERGICGGA